MGWGETLTFHSIAPVGIGQAEVGEIRLGGQQGIKGIVELLETRGMRSR